MQGLGKDLKEFEMRATNDKWKERKGSNARKLGVQFSKTMMFDDAKSKSSNLSANNDATRNYEQSHSVLPGIRD